MTQKITISVPDDLHEKMQHWKDSFNYSKLFQDVVKKEIKKKEDFQNRLKGDASMDGIIERLKKEKEESGTEYFEHGKTEGLEWAKASHYDEIQIAVRFEKEWQYGQSVMGFLGKYDDYRGAWSEYWEGIMENDSTLTEDEDGPNDNLNRFIHGWTEGVKEFWDEVSSKI